MFLYEMSIKKEPDSWGTDEGMPDDLYANHELEQDLVVGPVQLQRSDFSMRCADNDDSTKEDSTRCSSSGDTKLIIRFKIPNTGRHSQKNSDTDSSKGSDQNDELLVEHKLKQVKRRASSKRYKSNDDICKKKPKKIEDLTKHVNTEKSFMCEICNKVFTTKWQLKTHMRIHTGEKPYICKICDKSFSQYTNLSNHERTHTGEKPFKCKICKKKFTQISGLQYHERTHTGEKPFKCKLCNKKFTQSSGLINHNRTHTGEKPFKCKMCNMTFTQSSGLGRHINIFHST